MATFKEFYQSLSADEKRKLAADAGTSVAYLSHIAHGYRRAGRISIVRLMQADQRITLPMLVNEFAE